MEAKNTRKHLLENLPKWQTERPFGDGLRGPYTEFHTPLPEGEFRDSDNDIIEILKEAAYGLLDPKYCKVTGHEESFNLLANPEYMEGGIILTFHGFRNIRVDADKNRILLRGTHPSGYSGYDEATCAYFPARKPDITRILVRAAALAGINATAVAAEYLSKKHGITVRPSRENRYHGADRFTEGLPELQHELSGEITVQSYDGFRAVGLYRSNVDENLADFIRQSRDDEERSKRKEARAQARREAANRFTAADAEALYDEIHDLERKLDTANYRLSDQVDFAAVKMGATHEYDYPPYEWLGKTNDDYWMEEGNYPYGPYWYCRSRDGQRLLRISLDEIEERTPEDLQRIMRWLNSPDGYSRAVDYEDALGTEDETHVLLWDSPDECEGARHIPNGVDMPSIVTPNSPCSADSPLSPDSPDTPESACSAD